MTSRASRSRGRPRGRSGQTRGRAGHSRGTRGHSEQRGRRVDPLGRGRTIRGRNHTHLTSETFPPTYQESELHNLSLSDRPGNFAWHELSELPNAAVDTREDWIKNSFAGALGRPEYNLGLPARFNRFIVSTPESSPSPPVSPPSLLPKPYKPPGEQDLSYNVLTSPTGDIPVCLLHESPFLSSHTELSLIVDVERKSDSESVETNSEKGDDISSQEFANVEDLTKGSDESTPKITHCCVIHQITLGHLAPALDRFGVPGET